MKNVANGSINLTTEDRVPFSSTDLQITDYFGPNDLDINFYANYGRLASKRAISFGMNKNIVTGTYSIMSGGPIRYANYFEYHEGPNGENEPYQYEGKGGSVQIVVTRTAKTTRYVVTHFQISAERTIDNEPRTLTGNYTVYIDPLP